MVYKIEKNTYYFFYNTNSSDGGSDDVIATWMRWDEGWNKRLVNPSIKIDDDTNNINKMAQLTRFIPYYYY